jgi:hypothetical protein
MRVFYLILFVVSATSFAADIVLRYVENIKGFDINGKDGKLFRIKYNTIPLEKFLPENVTMLLLAVMAGSATGSILNIAGVPWYVSLPCTLVSGLALCFFVQYHADNALNAIKRNNLPKGEKAAGLDGYCSSVFVDGAGKVKLFHKEREFEVNAGISADNDNEIALYDKVIALYESGGHYFVVKQGDVYNGIDTKF